MAAVRVPGGSGEPLANDVLRSGSVARERLLQREVDRGRVGAYEAIPSVLARSRGEQHPPASAGLRSEFGLCLACPLAPGSSGLQRY
jgi:hypothetical protein